jgi:hypothetical protein
MTSPFPVLIPPPSLRGKGAAKSEENLDNLSETMDSAGDLRVFEYVSLWRFMGKSELNDWLRPEYKRADFGEFVRGKYANRLRHSTNVIVLDPQVAKIFPNDEAVNNALRWLIELARSSTRLTRRSNRTPRKRTAD